MRLYVKFLVILAVAVATQGLLTRYDEDVYETIFCARVYLAERAGDDAAIGRLVSEYGARYRATNGTPAEWEAFEVVRVRMAEAAAEREAADLDAAFGAGGDVSAEDGVCDGPHPPATTATGP